MITLQNEETAETFNVGETNDFRIKASPKAFMVLSEKLYSDKIMAPIRELICNAWDSHIAAGREDVPIEVHLPNMLEPYFAVRDFGVGLSAEAVKNIFTVYFESTKTQSENETGCLGLGSKSPYAYGVKQYMVTSIFGGSKTVYSCFLDGGIPKISELDSAPTDEHNGVEVRFDVNNRYDYENFMHKTHEILKLFPNYKVLGRKEFYDIKENRTTILESDAKSLKKWRIFKGDGESIKVIMGRVAYPVDADQVKDCEFLKKFGNNYNNLNVEVYVGMGDVDFAPSREALSYDERTINNLRRIFDDVKSDIILGFSEKIRNAQTLWEAKAILGDNRILFNKFNINKVEWNGQEVDVSVALPKTIAGVDFRTVYFWDWRKNQWGFDKIHNSCININSKTRIFIADIKGFRSRVLGAVDEQHYRDSKSGYRSSVSSLDIVVCFENYSDADRDTIISELGDPEYIMVSTLPNPDASISVGSVRVKVPRHEFMELSDNKYSSRLCDSEFDPSAHKYYIVRNRRRVFYKDSEISQNELKTLIEDIGIGIGEVVFITESYAKTKNFKALGLKHLREEVAERIVDFERYDTAAIANEATTQPKSKYGIDTLSVLFADSTIADLPKNHVARQVIALAQKIVKIQKDDSKLKFEIGHTNYILRVFGLAIGQKKSKIGQIFSKKVFELMEAYPMLKAVAKAHKSNYYSSNSIKIFEGKEIFDYIKMVDKNKN